MLFAMVIVSTLLMTLTSSAPAIDNQAHPQVLEFENANMPNSYHFHYDANDGSSRTEKGEIMNAGTNNAALAVQGSVRWYDNKGQLYEMTYKAGKRGYRTIIKKVRQ